MTEPALPRLEQFTITTPIAGYWRVTFHHPPFNLMNAQTATELQEVVTALENSPSVRVVVLDSAHPEFFFARYDFSSGGLASTLGPTGLQPFLDVTVRLSELSAVSIASIRGRARGGGNELALACDMRFASVEKAIFGQPEVASSLIPGGGGIERLSALTGRHRALEIIASADDFDAMTAERYGWINRALPDSELDAHVETLARRLASFDAAAIAAAKMMINRRTLPDREDLAESLALAVELAKRPQFPARLAKVGALARSVGGDFELRMGHYLGTIPD